MTYRKGVTPVVAVVLLMLVTVAAAGTLYAMVVGQQEAVEDTAPDISLDVDNMEFESCWHEDEETHLAIRNEATGEINTSMIDIDVDGEPKDIDFEPEGLVSPQHTFQIHIDEELESGQEVVLWMEGESIITNCFELS